MWLPLFVKTNVSISLRWFSCTISLQYCHMGYLSCNGHAGCVWQAVRQGSPPTRSGTLCREQNIVWWHYGDLQRHPSNTAFVPTQRHLRGLPRQRWVQSPKQAPAESTRPLRTPPPVLTIYLPSLIRSKVTWYIGAESSCALTAPKPNGRGLTL